MTELHQSMAAAPWPHSNSALYLMSLVPDPSFTTTYHALDISAELHNALIDTLGDGDKPWNLDTRELKTQLLQYLDQPIQAGAVSRARNVPISNWLLAHEAFDLARLRTIISNWLWSTCPDNRRGGAAHRNVLELITPRELAKHLHSEHVTLFDEQGRPAGPLTFPGFALSVCDSIVGKPCHLSCGNDLVFERMLGTTNKRYELLSQILWHDGFAYAIGLGLSVQTVPPRRETRLNVKLSVHRFAHSARACEHGRIPYLNESVNALVRWPGAPWCCVPYRYDIRGKRIAWDKASVRNLKDFAGIELPDPLEYLCHIDSWVQPGRDLQILSPQSASATWPTKHTVAAGMTVNDKAEIFEFVASCLGGIAEPSPSPECLMRKNLIKQLDEKKLACDSERESWQLANRRRLSAATGSTHIELEFIGTQADIEELAAAHREAIAFLGPAGDVGGIRIGMTERMLDGLLSELPDKSLASARERMDAIRTACGPAASDIPTACIILLPNYAQKRDGSVDRDPKQVIRMGFALSGRLSQFLVPRKRMPDSESDGVPDAQDGTFGSRVVAAVRDLMRQLGFVYDFKDSRDLKPGAPMYGIHLAAPLGRSCPIDEALIATKINYRTGTTEALLPQIDSNWMPYWQAQLELACASNPLNAYKARRADGFMLKRLIDMLSNEAAEDALLLVRSYGKIRWPEWWPGIGDARLAEGPLRYGPTSTRDGHKTPLEDAVFDRKGTELHILRVRAGNTDEVPDYYTDLVPVVEEKRGADLPKRANKQGIFKADGYLLALAPKPGDKQYIGAFLGSKLSRPESLAHSKSLSEYVLLTSEDERLALECVRRAEASRAGMVQLLKSDMKINLPAPLHLAKLMEEYIWNPKTRRR